MADTTVSSWSDLFYELRGPLQKNFRKAYPLSAEIERRSPRELMTGNQVRVPLILNSLQGGGNPGETGTINVPQVLNTAKAIITAQDVVQPFSLTMDVDEQSMDNAAAEAMATLTVEARNALAEIVNDEYNCAGALLATVASNSGSPGLTITLTASANVDRLYPGRVVDVLTRSNGADPGSGKRRKINSFVESATAPTVTFATAQTASDGGSGNITWASTEGLYIAGTYGNAITSLADITATTGTFQSIDKAAVAGWQGIDGRGGVTTTLPLSQEMFDGGIRRARRSGGFSWSFAIGDPAVIDLFKQSLYSQVRYQPQTGTLPSGFKGISFDAQGGSITLIPEDRHDLGTLRLIAADDLKVYGRGGGPEFVNDDGAIARRFARTLPKEIWLRDKQNLAALRCNRMVQFANLSRAA